MEIISAANRKKYFEYIHYVLAILLPIAPRLLPVIIIAIALLWISEGNWNIKWRCIKNNKIVLSFVSLYLIYLAGMFYTENIQHGLKDLETKFSLLLFPLIYATSENSTAINFSKLFKNLAIGCTIAALVGLGTSTYSFLYELYARANNIILESYPYTNYFFSAYVSPFLHTGYFALYINVCVAFLFYTLLFKASALTFLWKSIYIFMLLYLSIYNVLLLSKIGLITMLLIYVGIFYLWAKKYFSLVKLLSVVSAILITLVLIIYAIPKVRMNFENVVETTFSKNENELDSEDGSASRLVAWKTSFSLVKKYFLTGVGTGDVKQLLSDEYQKRGYWNAYKIKLNAHNQFLQTTLAIGLAGFAVLLLFVFINYRNAFKNKNILHLVFISAVTLQFIVESSLETQAGVIFISFFNSVFNFIFTQSDSSI